MRVSVEDIIELRKRRQAINNTPLEEIEWTRNGEVVEVTEEDVEGWKFTGLSNFDFAVEQWIEPHIVQLFLSKPSI
jgi:hypothetical protein